MTTSNEFIDGLRASFEEVLKMADEERKELHRILEEQGFEAAKEYLRALQIKMQTEGRVARDPGFSIKLNDESIYP